MERELRRWALLAGVALLGTAGGCKSAKEEARTFRRCGQGRGCKSPNVCIRVGRTSEGLCVYPCQADKECPRSFRCTGAYRLSGKRGRYCRRPSVGVGGDCSRIQDGCKGGLRCFKDRCVQECKADQDCKQTTTRCLQVVDTTRGAQGTKDLYRGCLEAKQLHGQACDAAGPFCAREHLCYRRRCLKTCKDDKGCSAGLVCDGAFFKGKGAKRSRARGAKPDIRYCRTAGGENAACNLRRGKSCARGYYCLSNRCRKISRVAVGKPCQERRGIFCGPKAACYAGRCRARCKFNENCPKVKKRPGRCQARSVNKKKIGLCF